MSLFIRSLIVFAVVAAIGTLAALLARAPGEVTLRWFGWRIDTSVGVLLVGLGLVFGLGALIYALWRGMIGLPRRLAAQRALARREAGYLAITRGMVAIAAGDAADARKHARRASELLGRPPGALLIGAQAAQLEGRPDQARKFYEAMTETGETELLGLRGLIALAELEGDRTRALALAERARVLAPKATWVLTRLFHLQIGAKRWEAAEATLRQAIAAKAVGQGDGRHEEAVVLVQMSVMAERDGQRAKAIERARKAVDLDPTLLAASLQLAALLHAEGEPRRARRAIESAWQRQPHPDLARLYALALGEPDAVKRYQALDALTDLKPGHRESFLALARAALDARLWGEARRHLKAAADGGFADAGHARLMAEVEQAERADAAAARDWLARAALADPEPTWLCRSCGAQAREWSALCGHCGGFDTLGWTVPPRVAPLPKAAEAPEGRPAIDRTAPAAAGPPLPAARAPS
jgi:HemY protein